MYSLAFLMITSCALALLVTPIARNLCRRLGMGLDVSDGWRKLHRDTIPRVGGIPILVAYLGSIALFLATPLSGSDLLLSHAGLVRLVAPAVLVIFLLGLCDDFFGVGPRVKLAVQAAAAVIPAAAGLRVASVAGIELDNTWISVPLTVFWLLFCTNAFNLLDGVDGLAAGVGLFAILTMLTAGLLQNNFALALATAPLTGALFGFLRYNFNPASVFLGDSGSYTIGFLLGCFGLAWSQKAATVVGMTAPLMALAIPLMDTSLTVVRRFLRGQPIFAGDRGHIHHKLLEKGLTTRQVVLLLYGAAGFCAVLSLLGSAARNGFGGVVLVLFGAAAWAGIQSLGYAEFQSARHVVLGGGFRKAMQADLDLRVLEASLEAASTWEAKWRALAAYCEKTGFSRLEWQNGLYARETRWSEIRQPEWMLEIPLPDGGIVRLRQEIAPSGSAVAPGRIAEVLRRSFSIASLDGAPIGIGTEPARTQNGDQIPAARLQARVPASVEMPLGRAHEEAD